MSDKVTEIKLPIREWRLKDQDSWRQKITFEITFKSLKFVVERKVMI